MTVIHANHARCRAVSSTMIQKPIQHNNFLKNADTQEARHTPSAVRTAQTVPPQASAFHHLMFGRLKFHTSPLQSLLGVLKTTTDPKEKALLITLLGQSQVPSVMEHLQDYLCEGEPGEVRAAAARAMGELIEGAHPDSHLRADVMTVLAEQYALVKDRFFNAPKPAKTVGLKGRLSRTEQQKEDVAALTALSKSLIQTGLGDAAELVFSDFQRFLNSIELKHGNAQELSRLLERSKTKIRQMLEKQHDLPIETLVEKLGKATVDEQINQVVLVMADGEKMTVRQASTVLSGMLTEQKTLVPLVQAMAGVLAQVDHPLSTQVLRVALESSVPEIRANALTILSDRQSAQYAQDILPNLSHPNAGLRQSAFQALLTCPEPAATQMALTYLSPLSFLSKMGGGLCVKALQSYLDFLEQIVENGDHTVGDLLTIATHPDYGQSQRVMAIQLLGMMANPESEVVLAPETVGKAKLVLSSLATQGYSRSVEETDRIQLAATKAWLSLKDPQALGEVFSKIQEEQRVQLNSESQESLLETLWSVLQDEQTLQKTQATRLKRQVLSVLAQEMETATEMSASAGEIALAHEQLQALQASLPSLVDQLPPVVESESDLSKTLKNSLFGAQNDPLFHSILQDNLKPLQPILLHALVKTESADVRMLSARILGRLQAKGALKALGETARNPMQGLLDLKRNKTPDARLSQLGASIRLNVLHALGDLADATSAPVFLAATEDPILRRYALEPLAKLAPALNEKAQVAQREAVEQKLIQLIQNPSNTRLQRAVRMDAANVLYLLNAGPETLKTLLAQTPDPEFKRHLLSAFLRNRHGFEPTHPDHGLIQPFLSPELAVADLHAQGYTGKGVEMAIVDAGVVDASNTEAFQDRVKLPVAVRQAEEAHPTMVMSTAAANGAVRGVAPEAIVYSDQWPDFGSADPFDVYKKMIVGKLRGENNIQIINNSWGFTRNDIVADKDVRQWLKDFKTIVNLAEKAGILFVFAAGNSGESMGVPGIGTLSLFGIDIDKLTGTEKADLDYILDKVVTVGAFNTKGLADAKLHQLSEFSSIGDSFGSKVSPTLIAPGSDMAVYSYEEDAQKLALVNGTSFASPFVSGLIALLYQANPALTPQEIRAILTTTASKMAQVPESMQGAGMVNPKAALEMARAMGEASGTVNKTALSLVPKLKSVLPLPPGGLTASSQNPKAAKRRLIALV